MPSKSEQILQVMKAVLETIPDAMVERNAAVSARIPTAGLIILRDGDPGEPDLPLGGVGGAYYSHQMVVELYVQQAAAASRDAAFDNLLVAVGEALSANPTLGGLAFGITIGQPSTEVEAVEGGPAIKTATLEPVVEYETDASWNHCGSAGPIQDPPACGGEVTFVAGADLNAFLLVRLDANTQAIAADQSLSGSVLGVTLASALQGEAVAMRIFGPVSNPAWSWTPGGSLFLGSSGAMTQTPPTSGYLVAVGSAISATEAFINIEPAIQLL